VISRGRKLTLACRQVARALATQSKAAWLTLQLQDSARKNGIAWESVRTEENATPPELAKDPSRKGDGATNVRAWGRW